MNILNLLFPYKLHLHILQLEEYKYQRLINWVLRNFLKRTVENKKRLIWTPKAKQLTVAAIIYAITVSVVLTYKLGVLGLIIGLVLATQSYIYICLAVIAKAPVEKLNRRKAIKAINQKINQLKQQKLKVIGITGSYGKTSTKEFLYHILRAKYSVLKTPESYNVLFGLKRVVELELDNSYDFFICEMGAYTIGEIAEICTMIPPDHGILTGINEQHLERFGSIQNTIKAKFELIQALPKEAIAVVNLDNQNIKENISHYTNNYIGYGLNQGKYSIKDIETTKDGTNFVLVLDGQDYIAKTKLVGNANLQNVLAAATMCYKLGVEPQKIVQAINTLKPVPHRLEVRQVNNTIIIDDAYSSNITGFEEALNLLKSFTEHTRVLVTPGIIELGNKTEEIHIRLGNVADNACNKIILVGKSDRTLALEKGIRNKEKVLYINSISDLKDTMVKLNLSNPVVLLENDLPDNY